MVEMATDDARLSLHDVARDAQWLLQADPADRAALEPALGIALPDTMLWSAATGGWSALHMAPDEWLLIAEDAAARPPALNAVGVPHALVDVSHRAMAIDIGGPDAPLLLAGACGLDLATTAPGMCTRTLFGKITVVLWRRGDSWRIGYPRSYDGYVRALIAAIRQDLT